MHDYDVAAWLIAHYPSLSRRRPKLDELNPFRSKRKTMQVAATAKWVRDVGATLPKSLTNDEVERRWEAHLMRQAKAKRSNDG